MYGFRGYFFSGLFNKGYESKKRLGTAAIDDSCKTEKCNSVLLVVYKRELKKKFYFYMIYENPFALRVDCV